MIRIFIGFDQAESEAFYVLSHSIKKRSSMPVSITPVDKKNLRGIYTRPRGEFDSTEFSNSRFMVPWMCDYEGWAIFMDCDILVLDDIAKLWARRDDRYSLMCVKHNHVPKEEKKFLNSVQTKYNKKNWSSVMLLNCSKCKNLTPEYVNNAPGLDLHQFKWTDEELIGEIPNHWNRLIGYDNTPNPSLVHWTLGGPYFNEYKDCEFSTDYEFERMDMLNVEQSE